LTADGSTVPEGGSRLRSAGLCGLPLTVLFAVWLWFAFSSGSFLPRQWLLPGLALGLIGLIVSLLIIYPRRPRQLSLAVLGLFAAYAVWVTLSALWADSPNRAFLESGRVFALLAVFALAATYLTEPLARRLFRYLVMGAALFVLAACIWRLWSTAEIGLVFSSGRLAFPIASPDGSAALFLIAFWPLVWLAAGTEERAPVRGVALGLATGLLGLAIMTHSQSAFWSLAISAVIMFIVSPARLRTLFYLIIPGLLMVYEFPNLNRYLEEEAEAVGGGAGARTLLVATLTAAFMGMILALLERWIKISRRMKTIFGSFIFVAVAAGLIYGGITVTSEVGGPAKWLSQNWERVTDLVPGDKSDVWSVAWQTFESEPAIGVGADNFVFSYDQLRSSAAATPKQPHSAFLRALAETGIVGGALFGAIVLISLVALLWPRCVAGWRRARGIWLVPRRPMSVRISNPRWGSDPQAYAWEMVLLVALSYWLVHSSIEWIWQMSGVSVAALLFLAAGLSEVDGRAETIWRRLSGFLKTWHVDSNPLLRPKGLLSVGFRWSLVALSVVLIVFSALPYVTLSLQESALALAKTDPARAVDRAGAARWLQVRDPSPYLTQAAIFQSAAEKAAASSRPDRHGAVLDDLSLGIDACERAVDREPADWSLHYRAGVMTVNLLLATRHSLGQTCDFDLAAALSNVPGLRDWSLLADGGDILAAGLSTGSLAMDERSRATAHRLRSLSQNQLAQAAQDHLDMAQRLNPLSPRPGAAAALLQQLLSP